MRREFAFHRAMVLRQIPSVIHPRAMRAALDEVDHDDEC